MVANANPVVAQTKADYKFKVTGKIVLDDSKKRTPYKNAPITIYSDGEVLEIIYADKKGMFDVQLAYDGEYEVSFGTIESGYVPKRLAFNTKGVPDEIKPKIMSFDFTVALIEYYSSIDYSAFEKPVGKIHYSPEIKEFDYDINYTREIQDAITQLLSSKFKLNVQVFQSMDETANDVIELADVPVTLYLKVNKVASLKADENGRFSIDLEYDKLGYNLIVGEGLRGFKPKRIIINTIDVPEDLQEKKSVRSMDIRLTLHAGFGADVASEMPVGIVGYNIEEKSFEADWIEEELVDQGLDGKAEKGQKSSAFELAAQQYLETAQFQSEIEKYKSINSIMVQKANRMDRQIEQLKDSVQTQRSRFQQELEATDQKWQREQEELMMEISKISDKSSLDAARRKLEVDKLKAITDEDKQAIAEREAALNQVQGKLSDAVTTIEQKDDEIKQKEEEAKERRRQLIAALAAISIIMVLAVFLLMSIRKQKAANRTITLQHDEIVQQKADIEHQKEIVEEKNKEITDSITYAKRIQEAILPPQKLVKEFLSNSFVLYKPKDIVAGDFYWMHPDGEWVYFAAADCTGHGVPGAMVSVICNNGLNRSVREFGLKEPDEILNKTRELVLQEFEKSEEEVKDGMDIALCALNAKERKLQYAGAQNPLWIIRNGATEVEEIKPDKQPIGQYAELRPFTNHDVELNEGDTVYIFSDGYADQFGGPKGKKFKYASFKELLVSVNHEPLENQRTIINERFEEWRGELEQIDDVCVIGVRV
ncbi:MAG: SpoIIE family protein phosphatase [Flavobacteriales bacterium]